MRYNKICTLWLAVNGLLHLADAFAKRSDGLMLQNPRHSKEVKHISKTCMDHTELWRELAEVNLVAMAKEMEDIAQFWEQLLYTSTGGVLALDNCVYVAIDWEFEKDEYSSRTAKEIQVSNSLTSWNNYTELSKIRLLETSKHW